MWPRNGVFLPLLLILPVGADLRTAQRQQYIELLPDYIGTHACLCQPELNKFDFSCGISNASVSSGETLPCSQLPDAVINNLALDCRRCANCAVVYLDALTRSRPEQLDCAPPLKVKVHGCLVGGRSGNSTVDQWYTAEQMSIAQLGPPDNAGVGGYFTTIDSYGNDTDATAGDNGCRLLELKLEMTAVYSSDGSVEDFSGVRRALSQCQRLTRIRIVDSPTVAAAVAADNAAWLSSLGGGGLTSGSVVSLALTGSNLTDADLTDSASSALKALKACLTAADPALACVGPNSSHAWSGGLTRVALDRLLRLGRQISSVSSLYRLMDNTSSELPAVRFSLLLGHRWKRLDDEQPRSAAISSLDLSGNRLTRLPAGPAGMLAGLNQLNLSRNSIRGLFDSDICEMAFPHRCFWFRAAWLSLRELDLSRNLIEVIGQLQPWHEVSLNSLHLQHNRISQLDPLALCSQQLTASLMQLNLDDNLLTSEVTRFSSLTQLRSLSLQRNRLSQFLCSLLPQTGLLSIVLLNDNNISQLGSGCLYNLTGLQFLDLSRNRLKYFEESSLLMQRRSSSSARALLATAGQLESPVCNCRHAFARTLVEETRGTGAGGFYYPNWIDRKDKCRFYSADVGGESEHLLALLDARQENFLCRFVNKSEKLPARFCPAKSNCSATCLHGCTCYRSRSWHRVSLQCRGSRTANPADGPPVNLPAGRVDLSGLPSGRLRRLSRQSLRWSSADMSSPLTDLMLNSSGVVTVDSDALSFNQSIGQLWLQNNSLAGLDPDVFNSLASVRSVWLSGNPWRCSCDTDWMTLHAYLNRTATGDQIVADFTSMTCTFADSFLLDYKKYRLASADNSLDDAATARLYYLNDGGRLLTVCDRMPKFWQRRWQQLVEFVTLAIGVGLLVSLTWRLLQLRHTLMLRLRLRLLLRGGGWRYGQSVEEAIHRVENFDLVLWSVVADQECLAEVASALSGIAGDTLDICVHCHGGRPADPLPAGFLLCDSAEDAVQLSACIVVLMSDTFWSRQRTELRRQVSLRRPGRQFWTLRLPDNATDRSVRTVTAEAGLRHLANMADSDWRQRLATEVLRPRGSLLRLAGQRLGLVTPLIPKPTKAELVQPVSSDWPPFGAPDGDCADIFVLCWPAADCPDTSAAVRLVNSCLAPDTRAAINSRRSSVSPPSNWLLVDLSMSNIPPRTLLRRYRQLVVIATESMLAWLRIERPDLLAELEILLMGSRRFRRRVIVAGVGQIDRRDRLRLRHLADSSLPADELGNFSYSDTGEGVCSDWMEAVLYRRQSIIEDYEDNEGIEDDAIAVDGEFIFRDFC